MSIFKFTTETEHRISQLLQVISHIVAEVQHKYIKRVWMEQFVKRLTVKMPHSRRVTYKFNNRD